MKTSVLGVVGARLNSSRLPKKQLLELAGRPVIGHLFSRLDAVACLDKRVLATTADDYNQPLVAWAEANGREVFAFNGDVNDLVGRVDALVQRENPEILIYFCGDSPLIEPTTVDRLVHALCADVAADLVRLKPPASGRFIHEGFSVFRRRVWDRIVAESHSPAEREHVGSALRRFEAELRCVEVDEPALYARVEHRISVDTPSDYRFMAEVYRRWYADHPPEAIVSLAWVIQELEGDDDLTQINANVRQKSVGETSPGILLVCHAGSKVGMGHLVRSLRIAFGLQDRLAAGIRLLVQGEVPPGNTELQLLPYRVLSESEDLAEAVLEELASGRFRMAVFDLYYQHVSCIFGDLLAKLRTMGVRAVGIDSAVRFSEGFDLVVVPAVYVDETLQVGCRAPLRHGWKWLLLGRTGRAQADWLAGPNVLVTIGGSDVSGLGGRLPTLIDRLLPAEMQVHWVQGPFASPPAVPENSRLSWFVHKGPAGLDALIAQAHYGLAVFGVSALELLQAGVPTVVFTPYARDENGTLEVLRRDEVAVVAESAERAVERLVELISETARARHLSEQARGHVDGDGVQRLVVEVARLLEIAL